MPRVTQKELGDLLRVLNSQEAGVYSLEWAYGQPRLYTDGGSREVSPRLPTGQMADWMRAFLAGIGAARRHGGGNPKKRKVYYQASRTSSLPFGEGHVGAWVDGAFGEDHAAEVLAGMMEDVVELSDHPRIKQRAESLRKELEAISEGKDEAVEFAGEVFDEATEILQDVTREGFLWSWEAGDLVLVSESEEEG